MKPAPITINLDSLREIARRAYQNISFSPERRGDDVISTYARELAEDVETIVKAAPSNFPPDDLTSTQERYARKYTALLSAWLYSLSNTASSAIVGPSNFPTEMMQKRRAWADAHYQRFRDFRARALTAITKGLQPKRDELQEARQKLLSCTRLHRVMVAANKLIRNNPPDLTLRLAEIGLATDEIDGLVSPKNGNWKGFQPFELSNNKTNIHRLTDRVRVLEHKRQLAETVGSQSKVINGVTLVRNFEADRVQLIFLDNERPSRETCQRLRKAGFVFSYTYSAWQRKLTPAGIDAATSFLESLSAQAGKQPGN